MLSLLDASIVLQLAGTHDHGHLCKYGPQPLTHSIKGGFSQASHESLHTPQPCTMMIWLMPRAQKPSTLTTNPNAEYG